MPFSYLKKINIPKPKSNKWWKRIVILIITIFVFFGLFVLSCWIYFDYYLPYHDKPYYEALYKEGMNNVEKAHTIALELYEHKFKPYYYEKEIIDVLTNSAKKGNVQSMVLLGRYYKGYCIDTGFDSDWKMWYLKSPNQCSYWYLQAAKRGNAEAQGELGHNYKYGFGVKQDFVKAIYWMKQGADNGDAVAQWRMGVLYFIGLAYYRGYTSDIDYQIWWWNGKQFVAKADREIRRDKNQVRLEIEQVFLYPDVKKAKYYWNLAANQGLIEAKDSRERIFEGDDDL